MALLTHGPRLTLGSGGVGRFFSAWIKTDGAATAKVEIRDTGLPDWTVLRWTASTAVATAKHNTATLTMRGILPGTEYDYRILLDDVEVATQSFFTMPTSGRFVVYVVSDGHGDNQTAYDFVRTDWEANFEPSGVPPVILQIGDLFTVGTLTPTTVEAADDIALPAILTISGVARACSRIPILFMWNDWDFAGNNTSLARQEAFANEPDAHAAALDLWDWMWRDHPQPASPSLGYSHVIAGVPIIMSDGRSQRTPQTNLTPSATDGVTGGETWPSDATVWGAAQRTWLIDELRTYADRALVLFNSGDTFTSQRATFGGGGGASSRDSIGIFWKAERNHVFREGAIQTGYGARKNLIVLSGDDHWNVVRQGNLGEAVPFDATLHPGNALPLPFREFKIGTRLAIPIASAITIFGGGDFFDNRTDQSVLRMDITSNNAGRHVSARMTYLKTDASGTTTSDSNSLTNVGDFYFENGYFAQYNATSQEQAQHYPDITGQRPPAFLRWYTDEIMGDFHREDEVVRDWDGKLRAIGDVDAMDRDDYEEIWSPRTEDWPEDP